MDRKEKIEKLISLLKDNCQSFWFRVAFELVFLLIFLGLIVVGYYISGMYDPLSANGLFAWGKGVHDEYMAAYFLLYTFGLTGFLYMLNSIYKNLQAYYRIKKQGYGFALSEIEANTAIDLIMSLPKRKTDLDITDRKIFLLLLFLGTIKDGFVIKQINHFFLGWKE